MSLSGALDAIRVHLAAASTAPDPVALLHLAQARTLLVGLEEAVGQARAALEAMEREQTRKAGALVVDSRETPSP